MVSKSHIFFQKTEGNRTKVKDQIDKVTQLMKNFCENNFYKNYLVVYSCFKLAYET